MIHRRKTCFGKTFIEISNYDGANHQRHTDNEGYQYLDTWSIISYLCLVKSASYTHPYTCNVRVGLHGLIRYRAIGGLGVAITHSVDFIAFTCQGSDIKRTICGATKIIYYRRTRAIDLACDATVGPDASHIGFTAYRSLTRSSRLSNHWSSHWVAKLCASPHVAVP